MLRAWAGQDSRSKGSSVATFEELLAEHRGDILGRWKDALLNSYADDTARFLKGKKDRFANPVGHAIEANLGRLLDALIDGSLEQAHEPLQEIIRIRAVQEFTPSQAVGFVFLLKGAVARTLKKRVDEGKMGAALGAFEAQVDGLALVAFEVYVENRSKLFEIRIEELRQRSMTVQEKVSLRKARFAEKQASKASTEEQPTGRTRAQKDTGQ